MEYKITQIEPTVREVEITFSAEELKPRYDAAYKKILPSVEIKGFRKGRVPLPMVKKMFGASIEAEVNEDMVNEFLSKEFRETKINLIDSPALTKMDKNKDGSVVCVLKIDAFDDLILKDYKGIQIQEPVYSVEDEKVETELTWLSYENGEKVEVEEISNSSHIVVYDYSHQGADNPEPHYHEQTLKLYAPAMKSEIIDRFLNRKVGDKYFIDDLNEKGEPIQTELIIKKVEQVTPAEFTPELIGKLTEGKLETIDELREEIGFKLQELYDNKSREYMVLQLLQKLNEMHSDYVIPQALIKDEVKNQANRMLEQYKMPEQYLNLLLEQMPPQAYKDAEQTLRIEYLIAQIAEAENLEIEEYDIEPYIQNELNHNPSLKPDWIKERLLKNENFIASILKKKVIDLLIDFAETTEIPFDEYKPNFNDAIMYDGLDEEDYDDEDYDDEYEVIESDETSDTNDDLIVEETKD